MENANCFQATCEVNSSHSKNANSFENVEPKMRLWCIQNGPNNDSVYILFQSMEESIQRYFDTSSGSNSIFGAFVEEEALRDSFRNLEKSMGPAANAKREGAALLIVSHD
jgi:hypothetical protein